MQRYDFIVIGSTPPRRPAAIQAAKLHKTVLVVEKGRRVGGVSVHTGTIPSKTLRETVLNLSGWRERGFYGRSYRVKEDITAKDLLKRLHITLDYEVEALEKQFARNYVTTIMGTACFVSDKCIEVRDACGNTSKFSAERYLIAVGTKSYRPANIPFDGTCIVDSDEILELTKIPKKMTVIGAGVIGIEYASIFSALDVDVAVVESRDQILDFVDQGLVHEFLAELAERGIVLKLGCKTKSVSRNEEGQCLVELDSGESIQSEMVLFAAGRTGSTDRLNVQACGLSADKRGRLTVNPETFQTEVPHIYAAGDVIGFPSLASTSMEQGRIAACHAFDVIPQKPPKYFPYGIYSVPEISTSGMSEEEMQRRNIPFEVGIAQLRETSRGNIMGLHDGMMKLIFSKKTRRLLGVHIVGEGATELIHIGQAVMNLKGTVDYFVENVFNYPTLAEAYKIAALDAWNRLSRESGNKPKEALEELKKVWPAGVS